VQLVGKDFIGVSFKADAWYNFQKEFHVISEYFDSEDAVANKMRDQQFIKQGFFITFYDLIWTKIHSYRQIAKL